LYKGVYFLSRLSTVGVSSAEVISNALGDEDDENEGKKKTAGS